MERIKILWIDDDVNNPELMPERDALEELGCYITPIPHPNLLQINMASLFDCIIIDLSMPTGNLPISETRGGARTGFVLLQKIIEEYPESCIVVYTVFEVPEVKNYCKERSVSYWTKSSLDADDFALGIVDLINNKNKKG